MKIQNVFTFFVFLILNTSSASAELSVSFSSSINSTQIDFKSPLDQMVGQLNYSSDGATGFDLTIQSSNNAKMRRGNSADKIAYSLRGATDGMLVQPSSATKTISFSVGAIVNVVQSIYFTSTRMMYNSNSNPYQLVAGTYSDTITFNIVAK